MRVEIHDIENDLDHLAGTLRLQDGRIVAEPDTLTLRNIIAEPVLDWDAGANYWSSEQPEKFLRALHLQYRSPYLRASKVLEDGKGEPVTKSRQSRRDDPGDGGAALADHYADTWNALHGPDVPDEELQAASEELAGGPHRVTLRPDGSWVAHRFDDPKPLRQWKDYEPAVVKEAEHAPPGGVFLVNLKGEAKFYKGGQWIPAKDIANLPPDQKAKLDAAVQQAKMNRVQRGHVNPNELQKQLEPHARQLSNDEQVRAVNEARALHNYHGDLTLHRIEQLAKQQQGFLKRQNLTDKQRKQIEGNLARLHAMVPLAQAWGVSGQVPKELQEQAAIHGAAQAGPGAPGGAPEKDNGRAKEPTPAARTEAPLSPQDAAKALAKQAGHVAQPKEGDDAASALNRQLMEEGKGEEKLPTGSGGPVEEKPRPSQQSSEEEQFDAAWYKALKEDPISQKLIDKGQADAARERVLANLIENGVSVPARVQEKFADAYDKAAQRAAAGGKANNPALAALTSVEGSWERALASDPEAKELLASRNFKKRVEGLTSLMRQGLAVPEEVRAQHKDAYREAEKRLSHGQYLSDLHKERKDQKQRWSDMALAEGIKPKDLHEAAREIEREYEEHRQRRQRLLARAREILARDGYDARALTTNLRLGRIEDHAEGADFDRVAADLSSEFPEEFGGFAYDSDPNTIADNPLLQYFEEGVPPPLPKEEAYEKALDYLREQREGQDKPEKEQEYKAAPRRFGQGPRDWFINREEEGANPEAGREPGVDEEGEEDEEESPASDWLDDEEDDPFAFENQWKSLRAWIQKGRRRVHAPGQMNLFDPEKHPHAPAGSPEGGRFVSTHHPQKIQNAQERYASRDQTAQGGGLFGGEDLQSRRGFAKLPDGAPIVFTAGEFEGHTGKIVRDVDARTGAPRIVAEVDGRPGLVPVSPDSIEPLDVQHSWRVEGGGTGREEKQGGLYSAEHFLPKREEKTPEENSYSKDMENASGSPHEMTREEFLRTAWAHGTNKRAAEAIEEGGFRGGEFAPPEQLGRGISYGWDKTGLNAVQVMRMKQAGIEAIPSERHGFVYFARPARPGEKADVPRTRLKLIGVLPFKEAATDAHRAFIRQALEAGEKVPTAVLDDYPDLKEKYAKKE